MSTDLTLISTAAVQQLLGVTSRAAISNWRSRGVGFPEPEGKADDDMTDLYDQAKVEAWARRTGRGIHPLTAPPQPAPVVGAKSTESSEALAEWMTALAPPGARVVVDPASGGAIGLAHYLRTRRVLPDRVVAVDSSQEALDAARPRLEPFGVVPELVADSLSGEGPLRVHEGRADFVMCHPPFGRLGPDLKGKETSFGRLPAEEQSFAWLDLAWRLLAERGRAVVVAPLATLDAPGRPKRFRDALVSQGAVLAVVTLPPGVQPHRAVGLCLWVLQRQTEPLPNVLLVDGAQLAAQQPGNAPGKTREALQAWVRSRGRQVPSGPGMVSSPRADLVRHGRDLLPWTAPTAADAPRRPLRAELRDAADHLAQLQRTLSDAADHTETLPPRQSLAALEVGGPYRSSPRLASQATHTSRPTIPRSNPETSRSPSPPRSPPASSSRAATRAPRTRSCASSRTRRHPTPRSSSWRSSACFTAGP